jgi:hypothetical protein
MAKPEPPTRLTVSGGRPKEPIRPVYMAEPEPKGLTLSLVIKGIILALAFWACVVVVIVGTAQS